jgi:hypothetical protein
VEWLLALALKPFLILAYWLAMRSLEWLVWRFMPDGKWKRLLLTRL